MLAHTITTAAYVILGIGLLNTFLFSSIAKAWMHTIHTNPAGLTDLRKMFGSFILSCAMEHASATYLGHHHPVTLVTAWIEAAVSAFTAAVFAGVPLGKKVIDFYKHSR